MNDNSKNIKKHHWSRGAVTYQIYPISFKDSNSDGNGDLAGILEKIDYLNGANNSLGINAVWLCPFYKSPMVDLGYDVEDFMEVDPIFGNIGDFERLVVELHKRNIKVIIDFVGNHTSDKHKWFIESKNTKNNPKRDWYIWQNPRPDGSPPNNWISVFGGSAWELDKETNQYYFHSFLKEQPDLNWRNIDVQKAMMEVIDFWVQKGVDGFRVDAFLHFLEDKGMQDDSVVGGIGLYSKDKPIPYNTLIHDHSIDDLSRAQIVGDFFKKALDKHPEIIIVSEAYVGPKDIHKFQQICPSERFTIFNFNFIYLKWDAREYKRIIDEYLLTAPENFLPNVVFGNHDVSRLVTRVGEAQARIAAFLQFTLPGMIFLYYGDEIGMSDTKIPHGAIRDMVAKIFSGFKNGRDPERTPMQWDDSPHAGFSPQKPWLPVNDNYKSVNVAHEEHDPSSILSLYKTLINLRQKTDALKFGEYVPLSSNSPKVFTFEIRLRKNSTDESNPENTANEIHERYFIAANFGDSVERELLPFDSRGPAIIFSTAQTVSTVTLPKSLELMPFEGYIVRI